MKITNEVRVQIIVSYVNVHVIKQIASVFNIKLSTVYAIIQ